MSISPSKADYRSRSRRKGLKACSCPRGARDLAKDSASTWLLYLLDGSPPLGAPGLDALDVVVAWRPEGDAVFVRRGTPVPLRLQGVDLRTGVRNESLEIGRRQQAELLRVSLSGGVLDPACGYAYGYCRERSRLYLVQQSAPTRRGRAPAMPGVTAASAFRFQGSGNGRCVAAGRPGAMISRR